MQFLNPTPSTPLTVGAGALANIVDTDTSTTCELQGMSSTYFWWILDLGSSKAINKIELLQFWERTAGNTSFQLVCSDSPLTSSNAGTVFGSSFSSTTTPTDITRNDSNTARYWGLYRNGDFSADGRVVVSCFNVYDAKGIVNLKPSTPLTTTSGQLSNVLDVDTSTKHEVHGLAVGTTYFWWILDLGSSRKITKIILKQFYELVLGNANFQIAYSDSPLTSSNNGTQLGSNFSSTTTPTDITQTGSATARYWGLLRVGDFSADGPVGISDFNVYEAETFTATVSATSTITVSATRQSNRIELAISTATLTLTRLGKRILSTTSTVTATLVRLAQRPLAAVSSTIAASRTVQAQKLVTANSAATPSLNKQALRSVSATATTTATLIRSISRVVSTISTIAITVMRLARRTLSTTSTATVSLTRQAQRATIIAAVGSALPLQSSVARVAAVDVTQTIVLSRRAQRAMPVTGTASIDVDTRFARTVDSTATITASTIVFASRIQTTAITAVAIIFALPKVAVGTTVSVILTLSDLVSRIVGTTPTVDALLERVVGRKVTAQAGTTSAIRRFAVRGIVTLSGVAATIGVRQGHTVSAESSAVAAVTVETLRTAIVEIVGSTSLRFVVSRSLVVLLTTMVGAARQIVLVASADATAAAGVRRLAVRALMIESAATTAIGRAVGSSAMATVGTVIVLDRHIRRAASADVPTLATIGRSVQRSASVSVLISGFVLSLPMRLIQMLSTIAPSTPRLAVKRLVVTVPVAAISLAKRIGTQLLVPVSVIVKYLSLAMRKLRGRLRARQAMDSRTYATAINNNKHTARPWNLEE